MSGRSTPNSASPAAAQPSSPPTKAVCSPASDSTDHGRLLGGEGAGHSVRLVVGDLLLQRAADGSVPGRSGGHDTLAIAATSEFTRPPLPEVAGGSDGLDRPHRGFPDVG